jgi:hypothetical protein
MQQQQNLNKQQLIIGNFATGKKKMKKAKILTYYIKKYITDTSTFEEDREIFYKTHCKIGQHILKNDDNEEWNDYIKTKKFFNCLIAKIICKYMNDKRDNYNYRLLKTGEWEEKYNLWVIEEGYGKLDLNLIYKIFDEKDTTKITSEKEGIAYNFVKRLETEEKIRTLSKQVGKSLRYYFTDDISIEEIQKDMSNKLKELEKLRTEYNEFNKKARWG